MTMDFPLNKLKTPDIFVFFLKNPYPWGGFDAEFFLPFKGNELSCQVSEREDFMLP